MIAGIVYIFYVIVYDYGKFCPKLDGECWNIRRLTWTLSKEPDISTQF